MIKLPGTDTIKARIVRTSKDKIIAKHPKLNKLRLHKKNFPNSTAFEEGKFWFRKDPSINRTFSGDQTAFLRKNYALGLRRSGLGAYQVNALLGKKTLLFLKQKFIGIEPFVFERRGVTIGLNQQVYISKDGAKMTSGVLKFIGKKYFGIEFDIDKFLSSTPKTQTVIRCTQALSFDNTL